MSVWSSALILTGSVNKLLILSAVGLWQRFGLELLFSRPIETASMVYEKPEHTTNRLEQNSTKHSNQKNNTYIQKTKTTFEAVKRKSFHLEPRGIRATAGRCVGGRFLKPWLGGPKELQTNRNKSRRLKGDYPYKICKHSKNTSKPK